MNRKTRRRVKLEIYDNNGGLCAYCRDWISLAEATLDHLIPVSRGGGDVKSNLRICCEPCNTLKQNWLPQDGALMPEPWMNYKEVKEA